MTIEERDKCKELQSKIDKLITLCDRMTDLLNSIAVVVRGPTLEGRLWDWDDLPERIEELISKRTEEKK